MLQKLFRTITVPSLKEKSAVAEISEETFNQFLTYCAAFYGNVGNYASFGDTKIVPELSIEDFKTIISMAENQDVTTLMEECVDSIYDLSPRRRQLGLGSEKGVSTYYSSNCEESDAVLVGDFMSEKDLSPYNTRLFKTSDESGGVIYTIKLASSSSSKESLSDTDDVAPLLGPHAYKGVTIVVERGDHAVAMGKAAAEILAAIPFSSGEAQPAMLKKYAESFETGSIKAHMDAQSVP